MGTIKSYTDISQSKKLAEILPLDSADMHYNNASIKGINYVDEYRADLMDYNTAQKVLSKYLVNHLFEVVPCWSFAALFNVLPDDCGIDKEDGKYVASYLISNECGTYTSDNPVDACVAMIERLHEFKML